MRIFYALLVENCLPAVPVVLFLSSIKNKHVMFLGSYVWKCISGLSLAQCLNYPSYKTVIDDYNQHIDAKRMGSILPCRFPSGFCNVGGYWGGYGMGPGMMGPGYGRGAGMMRSGGKRGMMNRDDSRQYHDSQLAPAEKKAGAGEEN